ncbi:MAG TPA: hypothetical protein VFH48_34370 [Chloroflexota bacterium]|nr:hypothetical protein [Chloroflexota bacterium]
MVAEARRTGGSATFTMEAEARQAGGPGLLVAGDLDRPVSLFAEGTVGWRHCVEVALVSIVALGLALALPLATTVFALLLFGVLHNYFEVRYVVGRFGGLFTGRLVEAVLIGLTAIVLLRLAPLGPFGRPAEIVATYGLLGAVLVLRLGYRPVLLASGFVLLSIAASISLAYADYHFVAITHLHNVLPLVFLWEWTSRGPGTGAERAFRLLNLTWAVLLPGLILAGVFGQPASADPTPATWIVGSVDGFVRTMVLPGGDMEVGARLLSVFALLQLMHYYVWCRFFPSVGGVEVARFDRTMRGLRLPRGRLLSGLVVLLAAATPFLICADFWLGRSVYGALAGYHAHLEYALLLLFVLAWRRP